ncbi:hypothetical protein B7463_g2522, partial [Scytalidium lignicola]
MALCENCQRFDIQEFSKYPLQGKSLSVADVDAGAAVGCEFCLLLRDYTQETLKRARLTTPADIELRIYISITDVLNPGLQEGHRIQGLAVNRFFVHIAPRFWRLDSRDWPLKTLTATPYELRVVADLSSAAAKNYDVVGRCFGPDLKAKEYSDYVREWLKECILNHPQCRQTVSGAEIRDPYSVPLPTRCLEILNNEEIILRETAGQCGTYVTLTHRWNASTERFKTKMINYKQRLAGKLLDSMPKVFKDAIHVARELDVKYVWIDSICIIQDGDDGADWRHEAVKMAQYYQNSLLTIASVAGSDNRGLFLSDSENIVPQQLARLPYRNKSGLADGHFYVYKQKLLSTFYHSMQDSLELTILRGTVVLGYSLWLALAVTQLWQRRPVGGNGADVVVVQVVKPGVMATSSIMVAKRL